MIGLSSRKSAVDEAVAHIHRQYGETVYVRRLLIGGAHPVYDEDLTRQEQEVRLLAIVQRNPSQRMLRQFGRKNPVDLLLTFSHLLVTTAGMIETDITAPGTIVLYRGVRHTIVRGEEQKTPIVQQTSNVDQTAEDVQFSVLAVIETAAKEAGISYTEVEHTPSPSIVSATIAATTQTLSAVLSASCVSVGIPMKRLRVRVNGVIVAQDSTNVVGTALTITLTEAVQTGQTVTLSYEPQLVVPVTDGIVAAGVELGETDQLPVTVT